MTTSALYDTILLVIITLAAVIHLNRMRGRSWIECIGFALIVAGAAGRACEYWWEWQASGAYAVHFLFTGLAIISLKVGASDLQRMTNYDKALQNFPREILEAATVIESREDVLTLKMAAHAALAREGVPRATFEPQPGPGDAFLDQRFNRQA